MIIPTYQRRESLGAVIEPLLADPALRELVVTVDGSTDGTAEWLQQRGSRDSRLTVLRLPNRGVSAARQAGLEAVRTADCQAVGIANPLFGRGARQEDREFGIRCLEAWLRGVFDRRLVVQAHGTKTSSASPSTPARQMRLEPHAPVLDLHVGDGRDHAEGKEVCLSPEAALNDRVPGRAPAGARLSGGDDSRHELSR